jgi:hypothetical protein
VLVCLHLGVSVVLSDPGVYYVVVGRSGINIVS